MDFLKPETLDLFLIYVVPGFVTMKVHDLLWPPKARKFSDALIEIVSYSMLNLAALFWLVQILKEPGFKEAHPLRYTGGMLIVVALAPALWAFLSRSIRVSSWFQRYSPHPTPSAWDYFFRKRESAWVLLHLKSGKMLGGFFHTSSFASSYPEDPEIYFEEVWRVDGEGRFKEKIPLTNGALVRMSECTHFEFFRQESKP